ncbi:hypothetical protein EYF80_040548 [Liparis tanakae]|uniref:Uncharacterized protein n=1 Tax=Liparis tanakae TaxID=230148 RepID=A0A4Z2G7Z6_9TELE|nr:hypothetical protein EYF80_040548 [Liparis tanakae]
METKTSTWTRRSEECEMSDVSLVHLILIFRPGACDWSMRMLHGSVAFPPRRDSTFSGSAATESRGPFSEDRRSGAAFTRTPSPLGGTSASFQCKSSSPHRVASLVHLEEEDQPMLPNPPRLSGSGPRDQVPALRDLVSGIRSQGSGLRSQLSGIWSQGSGLRDQPQGSGLRDQVSGISSCFGYQ